jgi:MoxR-like ATPase
LQATLQPASPISAADLQPLRDHLNRQVVGQQQLVERLLVALLADGHLLVEGAPGLAKTRAVKALAEAIEGDFQRIQFTPDLLPADITGSDIYRPQSGEFEFQSGPLFHNIVLADEINRAPAKVQAALLEAMAERQVSVGKTTYPLPSLFMVMATQNPIEQEGTYPLPEAQMDRFLMHVEVAYPAAQSERDILALSRSEASKQPYTAPAAIAQSTLFAARQAALAVHMDERVEEYLVQLILATRRSDVGQLGEWLDYGASPRATIALDRCARALAWLNGKSYVTPDDIRAVAHDVLRHRLIRSFEAEANGITVNQVIDELLALVPSA